MKKRAMFVRVVAIFIAVIMIAGVGVSIFRAFAWGDLSQPELPTAPTTLQQEVKKPVWPFLAVAGVLIAGLCFGLPRIGAKKLAQEEAERAAAEEAEIKKLQQQKPSGKKKKK